MKRAFWKVAVLYFLSSRLTIEAHAAYMRFCTSGAGRSTIGQLQFRAPASADDIITEII